MGTYLHVYRGLSLSVHGEAQELLYSRLNVSASSSTAVSASNAAWMLLKVRSACARSSSDLVSHLSGCHLMASFL